VVVGALGSSGPEEERQPATRRTPYGVGADVMLSTYRFLDLTPRGRQRYINEWPWRDTYGARDRHEHHH
jgi:predicted dithiol-disulfide oxidoreductase (DUF899 family)